MKPEPKQNYGLTAWIVVAAILFLVVMAIVFRSVLDKYDQTEKRVDLYHFTTEKGLECVGPLSAPSCNGEAWNLKTNYGMYPEKETQWKP